jgi:glycosyltransferase involved in cell wall biosynthesis
MTRNTSELFDDERSECDVVNETQSEGRAANDARQPSSADATSRPIRVCMHVMGTGRTDVRVMREATALVAAGYDVTVVDFERDASRPAREDAQGIHFRHVVMPSRFVKSRIKQWFLVKLAIAVMRAALVMARTPADVYHAHEDNALYACYAAAVVRGKALVFDAHELPLVQPNLTRWRRLCAIARWNLRRMTPRCAGVMTVSPPIVDELQRRYGGKRAALVRNIPPYMAPIASDRLREHLGLGPHARIALYQGVFQENRSLDILVRTAKYLGPDDTIVLMGAGPAQRRLETLIQQEGVSDRIKIIPSVPYEELLSWTASADVGLIVYDGAYSPNVQYCLPNKLFEYLLVGVPVFASPLDAIAEIIGTYDVGAITPSIEGEVVARHLSALLADAAARERMRRNGLAASQQDLRWEVEQEQLLALYREAIGAPAQSATPVAAAVR